MSNVINIMTKQRKVKHLFIYESYANMDRVKTLSVKNMVKQDIKHNDLGSRVIMDDRIMDFTFNGDNLNKLLGNRYQLIIVYGDLDNDDMVFVNTLLENKYSEVRKIERSR